MNEVPYELEAALELLACLWPDAENPFRNSGAGLYDLGAFKAHSYSWGDEEQPWNFKWEDLEVKWYKYVGRGMECNTVPSREAVAIMVRECIDVILHPLPAAQPYLLSS